MWRKMIPVGLIKDLRVGERQGRCVNLFKELIVDLNIKDFIIKVALLNTAST
jgi:hypothetical protein